MGGLDKSKRILLLKDAKELVVAKGQKLFEAGDIVKGIYIVVEGVLRETMDHTEKRKG